MAMTLLGFCHGNDSVSTSWQSFLVSRQHTGRWNWTIGRFYSNDLTVEFDQEVLALLNLLIVGQVIKGSKLILKLIEFSIIKITIGEIPC